ncbi:DUF2269 domain-containing protein (plasmid) [Metabacillus halosaccharovorans]|uniref:DUF2269 domain-containing protein n=1 Tax=Metabacillus halosaccharovorans TaxID=930124 RepID=UPI00203D4F88|nr:DUF2269 domain-containing protein [Metabacillus halosaccharovorans]MCM3444164.1 DUF2269 domain-containing protein [Metabacillus halosaccharovorans]
MKMSPRLRKFALTTHIAASVGWIGAIVAYLALVVATQNSQDAQTVRAAFIAMEPIIKFALVPLSFASLLTGFIMSLGTSWGLFRHYWVFAKLLLTIFSTLVLLTQLEPISYMARIAAAPSTDLAILGGGGQFLHPGVGLLVLLIIMTLSVYKPRGMTRYGWRKQQEKRKKAHL